MDHRAKTWYRRRTSHWQDWPLAALLDAKQRCGARISVVMPARNEEQTVAGVVGPLALVARIRTLRHYPASMTTTRLAVPSPCSQLSSTISS